MGTLIRRLRTRISHWPFPGLLGAQEPVPDQPEAAGEVAFRFKDCGDDSEPSAEEIEAKERDRAERFKRDQILPVMGMGDAALKMTSLARLARDGRRRGPERPLMTRTDL